MEIALSIPTDFMESLKEQIDTVNTKDIIADALAMLRWAAIDIEQGRAIWSVKLNGTEPKELVCDTFTRIRAKRDATLARLNAN